MKFRRSVFSGGSLVTVVLFVMALLTAAQAHAERPRVGLVLGGGGARGAAHIGVLRELERHRVPIDAIAGTSMGAIVGGLYAAGMSVAELQDVVATLDWADTMSDTPPRKDLSFRRKQDDAHFPIDLELGLRGSELVVPMGVIQGQDLELLLRELTIGVSGISDFDDLPIPFRAVASDIESGEAVILDSGDLAQAIRASMAVPGALAPVRIGDRLLVDGGLVGNLPIDVARTMGVDVVIAVDVEFPLYSADELDSAFAISEQMLTILIHKETRRQIDTLGDDDVLIRPELGTFASSDFGRIADTLEPGAEAARAVSASLRRLTRSESEYAEHVAQRPDRTAQVHQLAPRGMQPADGRRRRRLRRGLARERLEEPADRRGAGQCGDVPVPALRSGDPGRGDGHPDLYHRGLPRPAGGRPHDQRHLAGRRRLRHRHDAGQQHRGAGEH